MKTTSGTEMTSETCKKGTIKNIQANIHFKSRIVNKQKFQVLRNGILEDIFSELIKVGDVIFLEENHTVPCDAVLLASSNQVSLII